MSTESSHFSRRDLLGGLATGATGIALASLLQRDGLPDAEARSLQAERASASAKAKRVIHIFFQGGLSQVDSFDYKPDLERFHGKEIPADEKPDVFGKKIGLVHRPFWKFRRYGESGLWASDLFPHLARHVDEFAFVHSMTSPSGNHTPATYVANCGFNEIGYPAMGAWLSYGLGSLSDDLPSFIVFADQRGLPAGGANLWGNGFLPARSQGVLFQSKGSPIANLASSREISDSTSRARLALLEKINRRHLEARGGSDALSARMKAYELSARMQLSVPQALDVDGESEETKTLYGLDRAETSQFGRVCLLTRRLVERDVRFVQLWSGATLAQPTWDSHGNLEKDHWREAVHIDRPLAGLISDLRRRGLLDDTLLVFSTEFGRTPFTEVEKGKLGSGRDHNQAGFTTWLAGAGVRGGTSYGKTDSLGFRSVENVATAHDFHATILHLLGIDHEELTYYHNGFERRLTNVHGEVIHDVLA